MVEFMVRGSRGYRSRTRSLFRKDPRKKGKISISKLLQIYNVGDKVCIKTDSSVHKGMPHTRYYGRIGVINGKRGRSYIVNVSRGRNVATLLVRPEHLESRGS
jgi:large subunit ribosomal protein L21e